MRPPLVLGKIYLHLKNKTIKRLGFTITVLYKVYYVNPYVFKSIFIYNSTYTQYMHTFSE